VSFEARLGDRSLFPDLEARAYLSHAAISPPSTAVRAAAEAVLDDYMRRGMGAFTVWLDQRARLREKIAALVGAYPEEIAFVPNTTRGVTDVALCFPWQRRDRVVLFEGEFPANVTPWQRAAELFHLDTTFVSLEPFARSADEGLDVLRTELARGVRLVAVSAVQFQSGLRMPVEAMARLCRQHGAQLFVDGIQAIGAVPLDLGASGIDYLSCGAHKWLMGLEGVGFLYVRQARAAQLRPNVAGWLSHQRGLGFLFEGPGHLRYDRLLK
jgi:selenocysteine lyase/cysteine desulfurase